MVVIPAITNVVQAPYFTGFDCTTIKTPQKDIKIPRENEVRITKLVI